MGALASGGWLIEFFAPTTPLLAELPAGFLFRQTFILAGAVVRAAKSVHMARQVAKAYPWRLGFLADSCRLFKLGSLGSLLRALADCRHLTEHLRTRPGG
jgi:hypothetical protein